MTTVSPHPVEVASALPFANSQNKSDIQEDTLSTQNGSQSEARSDSLTEYVEWLAETPKTMPLRARATRQSKQEFEMPMPSKEGLGDNVNYTIEQLKATASSLRLRRSGTKAVLRQRIHAELVRSHYASCIQSHYRGHLFRRYLTSKGLNGCKRPKTPSNDTELLSLERVESIEFDNLINVPNHGGKDTVYSALTLNNLIAKQLISRRVPLDPYTNMPFKQEELCRIREENRLAILLKRREIPISKSSEETNQGDYNLVNLTHIVMEICSHLDSLGHITNPQWFLNLSTNQWRVLNNNISDIWIYRSQLPLEMRLAIGGRANLGFIRRGLSPGVVMRRVIDNIRRLIMRSHDREHQALGAIYVLIAMTQVSPNAAEAMPALHEAGINGSS